MSPVALSDAEIRAFLSDRRRTPPSSLHLGWELLDFSVEGGWALSAFTPRKEFLNPVGSVQGGFVTAMLDDAMGVAGSIHARFAKVVPTLQINVMFLRPTPLARLIARGEVVRMGATTAQFSGTLSLEDGTMLATATASAAVREFPASKRIGGGES